MLKDKIAAFTEKIRFLEGITSCALVSRDGIIAGKYFDRDLNEPWFGALAATILASAESAGNLIGMKSVGTVSVVGSGSSMIVVGAGEHFLVAALMNGDVQKEETITRLHAIAAEIGQVM